MAKTINNKSSIFRLSAALVVLAAISGVCISTVRAQVWTEPVSAPPNNNANPPIWNQSTSAQPTSNFWISGNGRMGALILPGSTSGTITVDAPSAVTSYTMMFPATAGTNGQVLTTNGSGTTSWTTIAAGGAQTPWTSNINAANYSLSSLRTLTMTGSSSGTVTVQTAAAAGTWTLTLPTSAGSNGQVLRTDGAGVLSWVNDQTGSSGISGSGTINYIPKFTGSTTNLGNSLLSDNGSTVSNAGSLAVAGTVTAGNAIMGTAIPAGYYQDTTNGAYRAFNMTNAGFYFQNYNGATTQMYVGLTGTYAGRVGIGNLTPAYTLDVTGAIRGSVAGASGSSVMGIQSTYSPTIPTAAGVFGYAVNTGVTGGTSSGTGLFGYAAAAVQTPPAGRYGVYGISDNYTGVAGKGPTYGVFGTSTAAYGVWGESSGAKPYSAVYGKSYSSAYGVTGDSYSGAGVYGVGSTQGVAGYASGSTVTGTPQSGHGVMGVGVAYSGAGFYVPAGSSYLGLYVASSGSTYNGVKAFGTIGVWGESTSGTSGYGLYTPDDVYVGDELYLGLSNPYIRTGGSYFIAPGGAYFNSLPVYTEGHLNVRGGIFDDTHATLTVGGGTNGSTTFSGAVIAPAFYGVYGTFLAVPGYTNTTLLSVSWTGTNPYGTVCPSYNCDYIQWNVPGQGSNPGYIQFFDNGNGVISGVLTQASDARLKKNVVDLASSYGLDAINALKPKTYNWNYSGADTSEQVGFIAQDALKVLPDIVKGDGKGYLSINYTGIIPSLVLAVQQLDKKMLKISSDGLLVVSGDLTAENNKWGTGSGWITCPSTGDCSCPEGSFIMKTKDQGSKIYCSKL